MAKFESGNSAAKGRGRPKGSRNVKKMLKAQETMENLGFNPIVLLVSLCQSPKTPVDTKAKIAIELSSLVNPKPKPSEDKGSGTLVDDDDDEDSLMEKVHSGRGA